MHKDILKQKKNFALGHEREAALGVILPRAPGGLRKNGVPYYRRSAQISLLAELYHFRIRAESKQHFVCLQIEYRHLRSI